MFYLSAADGIQIHESDFEEYSFTTHSTLLSAKIVNIARSGSLIISDSSLSCAETPPRENDDLQTEYCKRALLILAVQEVTVQNSYVRNSCASYFEGGSKFEFNI